MSPEVVGAIRSAGFDVLSVANNHAGDWGRVALSDTLSLLRQHGIEAAGGGMNRAEAEAVRTIERRGVKIGFLAFSDVGPAYLAAGTTTAGILLVRDSIFKSIVRRAAGECDILVVSFHFGEEYQSRSNRRQQILARAAVEEGADIVVGHHPHVIQEIERYRRGLIVYSLGNFIFDQNFSEATMRGLLLTVKAGKKGVRHYDTTVVEIDSKFVPHVRE